MTPRRVRALSFGERYFGDCVVHGREARDVFEALEHLAGRALLGLAADTNVGEILGSPNMPELAFTDSLETIEAQLAFEEEVDDPVLVERAFGTVAASRAMDMLLGAAAARTSWDARTLWVRSVGGLINERVRFREGCTCGDASTPSDEKMQRTRPAQAMEPRR